MKKKITMMIIGVCLSNIASSSSKLLAEAMSPYNGDYRNLILFGDEDLLRINLWGINSFNIVKHYKETYTCGTISTQVGVQDRTYTDYVPSYEQTRVYHSNRGSRYNNTVDYHDRPRWRDDWDTGSNFAWGRDDYRRVRWDNGRNNNISNTIVDRVILNPVTKTEKVPVYETESVSCTRLVPYIAVKKRWDFAGVLEVVVDRGGIDHGHFIFSSGVREEKGEDTFYTEVTDLFPSVALYKTKKISANLNEIKSEKLKSYVIQSDLKLVDLSVWANYGAFNVSGQDGVVNFEVQKTEKITEYNIVVVLKNGKEIEIDDYSKMDLDDKTVISFSVGRTDINQAQLEVTPQFEDYMVINDKDWKNKLTVTKNIN